MCPGTPEGSEVDNDGCGEYIKASDNMQVRILFANDSDEINPVFRRQVRELSDFLKEYQHPCEVSFVKLSSYSGLTSTGIVETLLDIPVNIKGLDAMVVGGGVRQD